MISACFMFAKTISITSLKFHHLPELPCFGHTSSAAAPAAALAASAPGLGMFARPRPAAWSDGSGGKDEDTRAPSNLQGRWLGDGWNSWSVLDGFEVDQRLCEIRSLKVM